MAIYRMYRGKNQIEKLNVEEQKKDTSNFIQRKISSKNLVFFVGSGCSVPAIPLMSVTMGKLLEDDDISNIVKKFLDTKSIECLNRYEVQEDNNFISEIKRKYEKKNIRTIGDVLNNEYLQKKEKAKFVKIYENFYQSFTNIEELLNWIQNGLNFNPFNLELLNVYTKIKKQFIETIPTCGSEEYTNNSIVFQTYENFYKFIFMNRTEENSKLAIFTTNYDLFNEYGLEVNNIVYTTGFPYTLLKKFDINQFKYRLVDDTDRYKDKWQPVFKEANLYKIHGSINWNSGEDGSLYQSDSVNNVDSVVIYPTMLKHKETAQAPYSELFREFSNCLQKKNTTLIVMGYGFPDEHINTIISQNLKNPDFNLIIFGDINEEKIGNFYEEFKNKSIYLIGGEIESDNTEKVHHFKFIVNNFFATKSSEVKESENE